MYISHFTMCNLLFDNKPILCDCWRITVQSVNIVSSVNPADEPQRTKLGCLKLECKPVKTLKISMYNISIQIWWPLAYLNKLNRCITLCLPKLIFIILYSDTEQYNSL